jgi:hypothetical protein
VNRVFTGGCLCGQLRFELHAEPIAMRLCWCRDCQYFAAGNATVNVVFPSESLKILKGELRDYQSQAVSGNRMRRRFCPDCGTPVFSGAESRPHLLIVRNGALDDTELLVPSATIWTSSAPGWAWIDETLPMHAGQPPPVA